MKRIIQPMFTFLRTIFHPAGYHGRGKKPPFFEGWYFKIVDNTEEHIYAVIPGVFFGADPSHTHAFVQVLDARRGNTTYHPYPASDFHARTDGVFDIRIGANRFTSEGFTLSIDGPERRVRGELSFPALKPWPVTLRSPGIMGWYAWTPFMQCYHGVISMDHPIVGGLTINNRKIDFSGGRGYLEKDWGRSFPSSWIWLQSNHFREPDTSLTASVAIIPWIRGAFPGFIIGFWHQEKLYRFATYTRAWIEELAVDKERVTWVVRDKQYRLEMSVTHAPGGMLYAPTATGMKRRIPETLNATAEMRLSALDNPHPRTLFEGSGRHTGMEMVGDLHRLVDMWATRK